MTELDTAKEFIKNYEAAGYEDAYEAYGGYSYDSTWAIIQAFREGRRRRERRPSCPVTRTRRAWPRVTEAIEGHFPLRGSDRPPIGFDEFGDTTNKQLSLYEVKAATDVPLTSGRVRRLTGATTTAH